MASIQMSHLEVCWGRLGEPCRSLSFHLCLPLSFIAHCLFVFSFTAHVHHISFFHCPFDRPSLLAVTLIAP